MVLQTLYPLRHVTSKLEKSFLVKASRLNGKKVVTTNAFLVGEVEAAELDTDTWQITHLYIGLTNEALHQLGL